MLFVFRKKLLDLISGCIRDMKTIATGKASLSGTFNESAEFRTVTALALGTIPAVIVGVTLNDTVEALFSEPVPVLIALFITGCILIGTFFKKAGAGQIGTGRGIIIGLAQAVAVIPGISRSGSTIAAAIYTGAERSAAGEFSFLLSIPVIAGAAVFALKDYSSMNVHFGPATAIFGIFTSFITGIVSLLLLMKIIKKGKIGYFGFYCISVSILGLIFIR